MAIVFGQENVRKEKERRLSTGQTIGLTAQDEKMLRTAYDYMQGFASRTKLEECLEQKRVELGEAAQKLPAAGQNKDSPTSRLSINMPSFNGFRKENRVAMPDLVALGSDKSKEADTYRRLADEVSALEDKLAAVNKADAHITFSDLETLFKSLGVSAQKRVLEHMMYEVDELVNDCVTWDEFCLCYYRNINDGTGCEPSSFFRIMEFIIFDHLHRGVIMEDDVMEILFVRIGAGRLESEIGSIFGNNLRALGGSGTLTLEQYLSACLRKTGRRALVT